jgi:tRNA threonylcarbamoyladenosine biosynthesis protein TsaB
MLKIKKLTMNNILLIETSSPICSVGLLSDGELKILYEETGGNIHAARAPEFVKNITSNYKIDAVAVSSGPGSYTGLRIGVSLAKGLAYGMNIPLIAVPTLDAMASYFVNIYPVKNGSIIIPTVDARRMEIYAGVYDWNGNPIEKVQPIILNENTFLEYEGKEVFILGTGAEKTFNTIPIKNKSNVKILPSARNMIFNTQVKFENKDFVDVAYFEPFYLKQFFITKSKKKLF